MIMMSLEEAMKVKPGDSVRFLGFSGKFSDQQDTSRLQPEGVYRVEYVYTNFTCQTPAFAVYTASDDEGSKELCHYSFFEKLPAQ